MCYVAKITRYLLISVCLSLFPLASSESHSEPVDALASYHHARALIDQSIVAYGGFERIENIRSLSVELNGEYDWGPTLSRSPNPPFTIAPQGFRAIMDRDTGWSYGELSGQYGGYNNWRYYYYYQGNDSAGLLIGTEGFGDGWYRDLPASDNDPRELFLRWFPAFIIKDALDNISTVRWLGSRDLDGVSHDVITFSGASGKPQTIYLDHGTRLIAKTQFVRANPLFGDVLEERHYGSYRKISGIMTAHEIWRTVGGRQVNSLTLEAEINQPIDQSAFFRPAHYQFRPDPFAAEGPGMETIAEGVHLARVGANAFMGIIEFEDFVSVIWSPFTPAMTNRGLELIRETWPDKEIRYLGLTHHWWDASGGLAAMVAAGAEIIAVEENIDYFTQIAGAVHTTYPCAPSISAEDVSFSIVDKFMVIGDGSREIQIYEVGPTPGMDQVLIYYLPGERVLFAPSFFEAVAYPSPVTADDGTVWLYRLINEMGLDIDIVVQYNGGAGTWERVLASIEMRAEYDHNHPE